MTWILQRKRSMDFRIKSMISRTNLMKSLNSNRRLRINRPWFKRCKDSLMKPCNRSRWWGETRLTEVLVIIAAKWLTKKFRPMKTSHKYLKCKWEVRCFNSKIWECLCNKCNNSSKCSRNNSITHNNHSCSHSKVLWLVNSNPKWWCQACSQDPIPSLINIWWVCRILYHKAQLVMEDCHHSSKWTRIQLWIILRPT